MYIQKFYNDVVIALIFDLFDIKLLDLQKDVLYVLGYVLNMYVNFPTRLFSSRRFLFAKKVESYCRKRCLIVVKILFKCFYAYKKNPFIVKPILKFSYYMYYRGQK